MPGEPAAPSPKARPVTRRTSIRQSLNLASVSKAFADVINKDKDRAKEKDTNKSSKKTRESRRLSAANPSAPRACMGETRSPSQATVRTNTPDAKVVTRRRVSATMQRSSSDEQTSKSGDSPHDTPTNSALPRAGTLRTRNPNTVVSSLPKYRPKSAVAEQPKQPPSPVAVRAGTRRRFHNSDDEKEEKCKTDTTPTVPSASKGARAISPLPQRAVLRPLNATPTPPTPTKLHAGTPSSNRGSPTRPVKTSKTAITTSAVSRPPSSSSSNSVAPHTPKSPVVKPTLRRAAQDKNKSHTNTPTSTALHPESPSPATRHTRAPSKNGSPTRGGNMSHISEGIGEDEEDEEDVEILLAPVANMAAPTPAMPRIQKARSRKGAEPKTPTRGVAQLPTRANMSYLSPVPPNEGGSLLLRPPQPRPLGTGARNAGRGSILSWEQLASEASKTLGEDELEKMLSDIPAPFRSGAASPALSATLEIPESPCLSALDSPSGYGSISQVLLPDVTPSPAMHASQRFSLSPSESNSADSPIVTLLRLQLAQAENIAKERLMQMQAMEQEIHSVKDAHTRQMQETARHIAYLEANSRSGEDQMAYAASLEQQLRYAHVQQQKAVHQAVEKSEESARRSWEIERRRERLVAEAECAARLVSSEWMGVRSVSEVELDLVRGDRAVISVLLAQLDQLTQAVSS